MLIQLIQQLIIYINYSQNNNNIPTSFDDNDDDRFNAFPISVQQFCFTASFL